MSDKFNEQKDLLLSIKHEISLLHQQIDYLIRNEKELGILDLDVMMNRTHTIYDLMCGVEVGQVGDDQLGFEEEKALEIVPEGKPDEKPEEKLEEKLEEKPEAKPEEKQKEQPEDKQKPKEKVSLSDVLINSFFGFMKDSKEEEKKEDVAAEELKPTPNEEVKPVSAQAVDYQNNNEEEDEYGFVFQIDPNAGNEPSKDEKKEMPETPFVIVGDSKIDEPRVTGRIDETFTMPAPAKENDDTLDRTEQFADIIAEIIDQPEEIFSEVIPVAPTEGPLPVVPIEEVEVQPEVVAPKEEVKEEPKPEVKEPEPKVEEPKPTVDELLTKIEVPKPEVKEPEPEEEQPHTEIIPSTLGEKLQQEADHSLAAKLQHSAVTDLRTAIGMNDKYLFIKELFGGNTDKYNKTLENLNDLKTLNGALIYMNELRIELQWNSSNEAYQKLLNLIHRKFD